MSSQLPFQNQSQSPPTQNQNQTPPPPPTQNEDEMQYIDLIRKIVDDGCWETTRNGGTKCIFGHSMKFSLKDGTLPILTTKKVAWKTCFRELMFFIRGQTHNRILKEQDVHIWDKNSTREFLDERGLAHYEEGDLGPVYGFQWRHWNAPYINGNTEHTGGIDQLKQIIDALKHPELDSSMSRRLVMTAWNPEQLDQMALPPCHIIMQFHVSEGMYLSCCMFQRSCDVGLGVPFNILSYSFLTHIIAHHCGLVAKEFTYFMGNAHIYSDHIVPLTAQTERTPFPFPKIRWNRRRENVEDYSLEDFEFVEQYKSHESIKMKMF